MTHIWHGGLFFALALIAAGVVVLAAKPGGGVGRTAHDPRQSPCVLMVDGATRLYVCANGRAYTVASGHGQDVGPVTPPPKVPAA